MHYTIEKSEKFDVIKANVDKLNGIVSPDLKAELVNLTSSGQKNIIIQMTQVKYCDSSGLSALLVGNRLCKNLGGVLIICELNEMVQKLLSISQLDSILYITPTLSEAKDLILMEEVERELNND